MSNETKYDVFEELLDAYDDVKSSDGNLHPTQELLDYDDRYDNAFPDDLPLIPKAIGEYITSCKARMMDLHDSMFNWLRSEEENEFMDCHSDTFARAWLLGVWCVEETGEIVKLEAENE